MADKINEVILSERHFLHDISSPLMVAHGTTNFVLEKLKADPQSLSQDQVTDRLGRIYNSLEKIVKQLNDRRDFIKSRMVDEA